MATDEVNKEYKNELERHLDTSLKNTQYAVTRFDIIIITLASSGVLLVINFGKWVIENTEKYSLEDSNFLISALSLFIVTILLNLLSQITSYFANKTAIKRAKKEFDRLRKGNKITNAYRNELIELNVKRKSLDDITMIFNMSSLISLFSGATALIQYYALIL